MLWYNYLFCFLLGVFSVNFLPHFFNGVSGNRFPTPFAKPRGRGLSSPWLNVVWGLFNLVLATVFFLYSHLSFKHPAGSVAAFAGIAFMSIRLSLVFSKKEKESVVSGELNIR